MSPVIAVFAILFPLLAQSKFVSETCDNDKENEFWSRLDDCESLAQNQYLFDIARGKMIPATCTLLEERLKCQEETEVEYDCLSDQQSQNLHDNTILHELEAAQNNSAFLGDSYIASCPTLLEFKKDYMERYYGETSCSFTQVQQRLTEKKQCEDKVSALQKFLVNKFAGQRTPLLSVICLGHQQKKDCQEIILKCKDAEHRAETEANNEAVYADDEKFFREIGFDGFAFADCPQNNERRRRSPTAFKSEHLTFNEMLRLKHFYAK